MKNKFDNKDSLLDFLKASWENGKIMDANNFSSTWDALVKNLKFEDGYRPEVTITDGDGSHTLTITKPDGSTTSVVIKDGKNGADGKPGAKGDKGDKGDAGASGFSPEVTIVDGDGEHTLTITKPGGSATSTVIKDGKNGANGAQGVPGKDGFSPEVTIVDGTDGTHTLTISKPDGGTTSTVIKDGKNGANGARGADGKQGVPGKDGFSPEVTIVDGTDGTHTLTITKPGGSATSTVIKDGKDGKDGIPGISYVHPLDKNSMAVMASSHTYYPSYQTDNFDASSPFSKFTPDIKVEVNSVAADAPKGSIAAEMSDAGWTKGLVPTSYVVTMFSNYMPLPAPTAGGNFTFNGGEKEDLLMPITFDVPIDSLKLPTADGTSKTIADIGFISSAPSFDKSPMFFITYPRPFLIPVFVVENDSGNQPQIIKNNKAILSISPNYLSLRGVPVLSREVSQELIAKFSPSRKSISELPNVFKYTWAAGTVHIPFTVDLLEWDEPTDDSDRRYRIQSDSCKNVEVYPMFKPLIGMPSPGDSEFVKSIVLNSTGREVMKLFIGDPNKLGLIDL